MSISNDRRSSAGPQGALWTHLVRIALRARTAMVAALLGLSLPAFAGYWTDSTLPGGAVSRVATAPNGNKVALVCHNCYDTTTANTLSTTTPIIQRALDRNSDGIELDVTYHAGNATVYIEHSDGGVNTHATLAGVLAYGNLQTANQPIFLEIKECYADTTAGATNSDSMMRAIFQMVRDTKDVGNTPYYAHAGRPFVVRALSTPTNCPTTGYLPLDKHLETATSLLKGAFSDLKPYVRVHRLFLKEVSQTALRDGIADAAQKGYHGVEVEHSSKSLFGALMQAKKLGLGAGVFTIPVHGSQYGELFLSSLREDVDSIAMDYDVRSQAPETARSLVQEPTALLHMNTALQGTDYPISYKRSGTGTTLVQQVASSPTLAYNSATSGANLVGTYMALDGSSQYLSTYNGSNDSNAGFLVSAVVSFDDLSDATTPRSIIAKSDAGGFALEQFGANLRFGVHVGTGYAYATYPMSNFVAGRSYFIVACYDGSGGVHLFVDGTHRAASATLTGGVTLNSSPIVIGTDPQGTTSTRYRFPGKIQQVMVQKWRNH